MNDKFNFVKGDVVEFCGELFFVVKNEGSKGVVNPIGESYYLSDFYWDYEGEITTFVRKPTNQELESLGIERETFPPNQ